MMCSLKQGKVACTQELLLLIPTPAVPLLSDSPKSSFLHAESEPYGDRFWVCIRTAMDYSALHFQKAAHGVLSIHNTS